MNKINPPYSTIFPFLYLLFIAAVYGDFPDYPTNPYSFAIDAPSADFRSTFIAVDLNDDGLLDFTFRSKSKLYAYDHNGGKLWEKTIARPGHNEGAKMGAADIDGDGDVEIAALNNINQIVIYNGMSGQIEKTITLAPGDASRFCAHIAVANIRGAGDRDAIIQTADTTLENGG